MDGGLLEPIPYRTALREGATHVLVLRSRDAAYRAPRQGRLAERTLARVHPELVPLLRGCSDVYNRDAAELERSMPLLRQVAVPPGSRLVPRFSIDRDRIIDSVRLGADTMAAALDGARVARLRPPEPALTRAWRPEAQPGRHTWMMSRIEMMPATWPFSITTRWRKPPFAIASAALVRSQSASANVARAVR